MQERKEGTLLRRRERRGEDGVRAGGDWAARIREDHLLQRHVSVPQTNRKVSLSLSLSPPTSLHFPIFLFLTENKARVLAYFT